MTNHEIRGIIYTEKTEGGIRQAAKGMSMLTSTFTPASEKREGNLEAALVLAACLRVFLGYDDIDVIEAECNKIFADRATSSTVAVKE